MAPNASRQVRKAVAGQHDAPPYGMALIMP